MIRWAAMKTSIVVFSPLLAALAVASAMPLGCGAATPSADSPENSEGDASSAENAENPMDIGSRTPHAKADPEVGVTVKDEDSKDGKEAKPYEAGEPHYTGG